METIKVNEIMSKYHILNIDFNGSQKTIFLQDIVDTDAQKNGHQFGIGIYQDMDSDMYFELDVLLYKDEIFDAYMCTIKKLENY